MNLNALVNYKHSYFTIKPLSIKGVEIVKSKCFGFTWYAIKNNELLCVLDSTVANDSWVLWKSLAGELKPSKNDVEMWYEESL